MPAKERPRRSRDVRLGLLSDHDVEPPLQFRNGAPDIERLAIYQERGHRSIERLYLTTINRDHDPSLA